MRALPILGLTLLGIILRFWRLGDLALIGDESYYWLWSRHLDWAYFDHPAGVAVLTWLSTALGGQGEVGIRWLNALLSAACIPLVYLVGVEMLSRHAGLIAAAAVAFGAPYVLTARFVYTDALQFFLMLLNLYYFWRLVRVGPDGTLPYRLCFAFGLSLALLFNTKYSAYLHTIALAASVLIDHRWLPTQRRFLLALLIAVAGLLPVVAWNATHEWASFRWQLSHLGFSLTGESSLIGNLYHGLGYLSWPLVALALLGLGRVGRSAERLLSLMALFLLVPVILSPANSPRNLVNGLVALLLLAGDRWPTTLNTRSQWWKAAVLSVILLATAIYGLGTVINLSTPSAWPRSSAVHDIHRDAAGWRVLGADLAAYPEPLFALDYSITSQIWYYSGRPAYTAWPQYQIWGIPPLQDVTVVGLDYLPEEYVTARLVESFENTLGPRVLQYEERGAIKRALVWRAEGLRLDNEAFLQKFDFLSLLEAAR
jgi:4-amino-4-deoxy-L-arabinose transferase-like glycosyltransferase